jgi:hypothetical protein
MAKRERRETKRKTASRKQDESCEGEIRYRIPVVHALKGAKVKERALIDVALEVGVWQLFPASRA